MEQDGGNASAHVDAEPRWREVADDFAPSTLVLARLRVATVVGSRGTSVVASFVPFGRTKLTVDPVARGVGHDGVEVQDCDAEDVRSVSVLIICIIGFATPSFTPRATRVGFGGKASTLCSNVPRAGIWSGPCGCASPTSTTHEKYHTPLHTISREVVSVSSTLPPDAAWMRNPAILCSSLPKELLRRLFVASHPHPTPALASPQAKRWSHSAVQFIDSLLSNISLHEYWFSFYVEVAKNSISRPV